MSKELFTGKLSDAIRDATVTYRALHKDGHYVWLETIKPAPSSTLKLVRSSKYILHPAILPKEKKPKKPCKMHTIIFRKPIERTIEGWVRALDLRDRETEGHTQRVTELTIKVARTLGFSDEELSHIRRGALLHDMGKMAIPDEILQKPGPLNEAEWEKMRQHPIYAYEMLSPIAYLQPALDIPFCHHERWNGSGYPRGLKGEEIPLSSAAVCNY